MPLPSGIYKFTTVMLLLSLSRGLNFPARAAGRANARTLSSISAVTTSPDVVSVTSSLAAQHPAYEIIEESMITEYGCKAIMYSHKKSGAQVMSVISPDENKVFGVTFRTPPADSTGIPHILEHSVLCGSTKFPVKEPFVNLLKGSLQNFLNAFTYPDRTCYPVASTNTKDFYNLVNVYLDAVLNPRAINDDKVLQQEGWHFELENAADPLTYKGVVYNEMKGVYSSPDSLMGRETQQALFPANAYGVDSGGDPLDIPNLTFDQFKAFHSSYYHPSNSRVYFYGNDDPAVRLELLDSYLKDFDAIPVTSQIQFQPKDLKHRKIEVGFPIGPGSEIKHMVTVNWLLNDQPLEAKEMLALGMLDSLLLGTSSSSLRKILTESQLGDSVTGGGLSDELLQCTFGVGLKGVKPENSEKVEVLVRATLAELAVSGFEDDAIKAALNTLEFRLREFNTGGFPRGLALMLGMMNNWIYDKPAVEGVRFEAALAGLKADLDAGKPVFKDLLTKYLVNNDHSVTVEMKPDLTMEETMVAEEAGRLATIKESLSVKEIEDIIEKTRILKETQLAEDSPEAKASLPRLNIEDIEPKHTEIPFIVTQLDGGKVISHDLVTSGILYADVAFDFSYIKEEDLELLPLFTRMVSEAGTTSLDETQLSRKIGSETGGVGTSLYTDVPASKGVVSACDDALLYFMVKGKSVSDKAPVMMELMNDMLCNTKFDNKKRAVEMLKESKVRKESSVISAGHTFGAARLAAKFSFLGYLGELTGGLTSVRAAGGILDQAENDWPTMLARLTRMRDTIVRKGSVMINLTGDKEVLESAMPVVQKFLSSLPEAVAATTPTLQKSFTKEKLVPQGNEGFIVPSQVNYVVKGGQLIQPKQEVSGSYGVVSRHLSTGYLWDNVRVVGGAYGGFARFSEASGRFVYLSYRDPNCAKTLDVYDGTAAFLEAESAHIDAADTLQAVIGAVSDLDGPMNSQQKGYTSFVEYLTGETAEDRQKNRDQVLNTNSGDFAAFAQKLKNLNAEGNPSVVIFGSQAALEAANLALPEGQKLTLSQAIGK